MESKKNPHGERDFPVAEFNILGVFYSSCSADGPPEGVWISNHTCRNSYPKDIFGQMQKKMYMGMSLATLFVIITTTWRQIPNLIITMYLYIGIPCGYNNYRIIVVHLLTWEKVLKKQVTKQCSIFVNSIIHVYLPLEG